MRYDFYLNAADDKRKQSALIGLESGSLTVEDLTHTDTSLIGIIRSGVHGYEVTITRQGINCGCKDYEFHGRKHGTSCKHLIAVMLVCQLQNEAQQAA